MLEHLPHLPPDGRLELRRVDRPIRAVGPLALPTRLAPAAAVVAVLADRLAPLLDRPDAVVAIAAAGADDQAGEQMARPRAVEALASALAVLLQALLHGRERRLVHQGRHGDGDPLRF